MPIICIYEEHVISSTARSARSCFNHHHLTGFPFLSVVFHSVAFRSRHTVLKFSRSPYLDNHLSESIFCALDTLSGKLSFHDIGP